MTNSHYKIALDVHDHGSNVSLKAKRGDTGRILSITLMDGSKPYVISSECYAVFTAKKADGNVIYNACTIEGNTITYAFTPQTTSAVGRAECEIKLYGAESKLLTSARFTIVVEDTVYNEGDKIESEREATALTRLVSEATALIHTIEDKLANGEFNGEDGEQGPQGISGVTVYPKGHFALEVDSATGDLYCVTEEGSNAPEFTMDENGNLYYKIKEA